VSPFRLFCLESTNIIIRNYLPYSKRILAVAGLLVICVIAAVYSWVGPSEFYLPLSCQKISIVSRHGLLGGRYVYDVKVSFWRQGGYAYTGGSLNGIGKYEIGSKYYPGKEHCVFTFYISWVLLGIITLWAGWYIWTLTIPDRVRGFEIIDPKRGRS